MKSIKTIISAIVILILLNVAGPEMLSFFDISYDSYSAYIQWFTTIGIFYIVLPDQKESIFI
jgi:hypothetical protein